MSFDILSHISRSSSMQGGHKFNAKSAWNLMLQTTYAKNLGFYFGCFEKYR
jgi:hypothetical protein